MGVATTFSPEPYQACLFVHGEPCVDASFGGAQRTWLDDTHVGRARAGLAHRRRRSCSRDLVDALPWRQREVVMYDRRLDEPRLTAWWGTGDERPEPLPVLAERTHRP